MTFQRKDAKNAKVAKKTDEQSNRKIFAFFAPWRLRVDFLINQIFPKWLLFLLTICVYPRSSAVTKS